MDLTIFKSILIAQLKFDKEKVLTAVQGYGESIEYTIKELQSDKEVVLMAVKNNGLALEFNSMRY